MEENRGVAALAVSDARQTAPRLTKDRQNDEYLKFLSV